MRQTNAHSFPIYLGCVLRVRLSCQMKVKKLHPAFDLCISTRMEEIQKGGSAVLPDYYTPPNSSCPLLCTATTRAFLCREDGSPLKHPNFGSLPKPKLFCEPLTPGNQSFRVSEQHCSLQAIITSLTIITRIFILLPSDNFILTDMTNSPGRESTDCSTLIYDLERNLGRPFR